MKTHRHLLTLLFAFVFLPALGFGQTVITYTTTGVIALVSGDDKLGLNGTTFTLTNTLTEGQTPNAGTDNQYTTSGTIVDKAFVINVPIKNANVTLNYAGPNSGSNSINLAATNVLGLNATANVFVPSISSLEPEPISSTNLTTADSLVITDPSNGDTSSYTFSSGTISSSPAITCTYNVTPLTLDFPVGGSQEGVTVNAGAGCAWTAVSNNPWITVSPASGSGTGTVLVTTGANTTGAEEIGSALIAGSAVNITQNGPVVCTFSVSPLSLAFPATGGAAQALTISASSNTCPWTASSSLSWLSLNVTSGTGSATVLATALPNSNPQNLTGNITVAGQSIPVSEAGTTACSFTVAPSSLLFIANGGSQNITLSASGVSCAWTASISETGTWASVSPSSGTGGGTDRDGGRKRIGRGEERDPEYRRPSRDHSGIKHQRLLLQRDYQSFAFEFCECAFHGVCDRDGQRTILPVEYFRHTGLAGAQCVSGNGNLDAFSSSDGEYRNHHPHRNHDHSGHQLHGDPERDQFDKPLQFRGKPHVSGVYE